MKTFQLRTPEKRSPGFETDLEVALERLFRRCPELCGFSIQVPSGLTRDRAAAQLEDDLFVADVGAYPSPAEAPSADLVEEIAGALLELIDERPEARELLRGRTFARVLN